MHILESCILPDLRISALQGKADPSPDRDELAGQGDEAERFPPWLNVTDAALTYWNSLRAGKINLQGCILALTIIVQPRGRRE